MTQPLWQPSPDQIAAARMTAFMRGVERDHGVHFENYDALWRWSVERREEFWAAVWKFCGVVSGNHWDNVLAGGDKMPGAKWFAKARLNFAENLLRRRDDETAIVAWDERGRQASLSFAELYRQTARLADALRQRGVGPGTRVAAFMPNVTETVVAMLAASALGATFSSCSPDFGVSGVIDRFGQIEPTILIAADGYRYAGKAFDLTERIEGILHGVPSIQYTIVVPHLNERPGVEHFRGGLSWNDLLAHGPDEVEFAQLPFDHPLYILYSSGTTGVPKCIVHGQGGTLLQHQKEHVLHTDLKPGERLFYFTTCGWMMWNWLVTALAAEATIVLYDGSPFHPDPGILWRMADEEGLHVFGTSAKYISALEKQGYKPRHGHNLDDLRAILSTGSPLSGESFDYVYREIKEDVCLSSISGGTDIVSCFALGNPILPVWRGELQCRGLGMKVEVFDDEGRSVVGKKGELVCTAAFPSMPIYFWNDADGAKYRAAYFERFPGVWCHGDYTELTERGGLVIYGRSDAVLNPGGVRIGTAEIYRQVEQLDEVVESLVIGQQWEDDVRVVLFVRLREGVALSEPLEKKIRDRIRSGATPRHVPARIVEVPDIPRTKSGKIVELAVREVVHGRPVKNEDALANPEALTHFAGREELAS